MHAFLRHKSSWLPQSSVLCVNDLLGLDQRLSHSKIDPSQPLATKARSGLKTLIYGTAAGIDPHRINRSKLPPWYMAGPCYRSPLVNFPPFPSRSALRAVGQSSRTALLLLPGPPRIQLSSSPALQPSSSPPLCPHASFTHQTPKWLQPPPCRTAGVKATCRQHRMASGLRA